jgi:HEPN domain-containing protein
LKAVLVALGAAPPRTHQLPALLDAIEREGGALTIDRAALADLTAYAVAPRYPGFPDGQADDDLPELLVFVDQAETAVVRALAERGYRPR